ncbi:hypothetical protein NP493_484g03007 [Ridgeia piscesae]|uniref:Uncharacterized protein n=1 Tax=Ridgeia piscesae TaxID=27915 RepID=A0AAD9KXJ3_RIDPI|nr:hypothetical protein NP493_484g03007 [Ridgeia piscesae]
MMPQPCPNPELTLNYKSCCNCRCLVRVTCIHPSQHLLVGCMYYRLANDVSLYCHQCQMSLAVGQGQHVLCEMCHTYPVSAI